MCAGKKINQVYLTLRSLTSLLYLIHVCRGSFTSPLIHCILFFMWLGSSHLFSYKCIYEGGVNFTSLLFMNVYRIYILIVWFVFSPLCWWIDKKGKKYLESLFMFISSSFIHICVVWFMHFIEYLYVYCYAWVKRELLWSLSLIHVYTTPWVLSSPKRGRLLA